MKVGISTASLFLKQETEDAIDTIKSLGADCVEVFFQTFYEYRPEFSKKLTERTQGLEVSSVHTSVYNFEPQVFNPSRRVRGDAFYWLDQLMRSAQLLNCRAYSFHGKAYNGAGTDFDAEAQYLAEAVEFCARYGVRLCLENVCWSTYDEAGKFSKFKQRIPSLMGVFDIKQARRSGQPYAKYIEDMSGSISHVHLSDVDEKGDMCLPGEGVSDFKEILKRLKDAHFDGNVLIEVYPQNYSDFSQLKKSLEFLKEIAYKI